MSALRGKIDFTLFVSADNANPNGDPLMETVRESTWMDTARYQMCVLKER